MNKSLILIFAMLSSGPFANASEQCSKLFEIKANALVIRPKVDSLPAIISETSHNMIVSAMKRDIEQGFDNPRYFRIEPIQQMLKIGIPREEVAREIRQGLQNELNELAKVNTAQFELPVKSAPKVSLVENVLNAKVSIDEFVEYYNLNAERAAVTKIMNFKASATRDRANPIEILKAAILTGQKDLAREAFVQSFRFNNLSDLVKLGIESGNNDILMNIGRISITKFLLFDRNQNYFKDGLNALLEVKGADKKKAEAMLIDLADILRGPEIFKNEDSVANFGERGNKTRYLELALDVLKSAAILTGRSPRDSVSHERFVETKDERILSRTREIVKIGQEHNSSLGLSGTFEALSILRDPALMESFANYHLKIRFKPQEKAPEIIQQRLTKLHAIHALDYALLTGDIAVVKRVIKEIMENDPMDRTPSLSDGIHLHSTDMAILKGITSPSKFIVLFSELAKDPNLTPGQLEFLKNSRKNFIEDLRYIAKYKPKNLNTDLFVTKEYDVLRHHKETIEYALKNKEQFYEPNSGLWSQYVEALHKRDLKQLYVVYNEMMTKGRGLDAVYVGFSIAVLENGGDINTIKALEKQVKQKQIGND